MSVSTKSTKTVSTKSMVSKTSSTYSSSSKSTFSSKSTSTSTTSTTSSGQGAIKTSLGTRTALEEFGKNLGFMDVEKHMISMDEEFERMKREMRSKMNILALEPAGGSTDLIRLDRKSIFDFVDEANKDRLKFNFDVNEFSSESINVNAVNNRIEIHGKKEVSKDGETTSEEYSKTYELPDKVNPETVTSTFFKDGVLTVELPVPALEEK